MLMQVTLPDTGVDIGDALTATITQLGVVVIVAVGGFFAYWLIRRSLVWARNALDIDDFTDGEKLKFARKLRDGEDF